MQDLLFRRDKFKRYIGSPYDNFLRVNNLPGAALRRTKAAYNGGSFSRCWPYQPHLRHPGDGSFLYHNQDFKFGALELQGLKIFLASTAAGAVQAHAGNCASCHQAPDFSDFVFHNTGVSQSEYDAANGSGAFLNLSVPGNAARLAAFNNYMPVSAAHPNATETFRHAAAAGHPEFADLGLWNIYLNPDMPNPQSNLESFVCAPGKDCSVDQGLASTIAQFKTPILRDLEDSAPYFHNGSAATFNDVINHYIVASLLARQGLLRNAPPEFASIPSRRTTSPRSSPS